MKKVFSFLGMAILGGAIALGGYKAFLEEPVVIERTQEQPIQTFQTNFQPAFETTNATYAPTDFTEAAEKTVHAVVHVKNTAVKTGITSFQDLFSGGRQYEQVGTGSGVIISADGYIVTNNHVIKDATNIEITLNNRKKYEAELIGADADKDIALLKIDADEDLPFIPFSNSDNVKIGEWVLAVGNPYNLTSTVTAGIVSAKGRDLEGNRATDSFIQTDAAVNPGNSGGALVNTRGELVGINTAISSRTGSYVGYSFAVPSNIAKKIIDDILEFGTVQEAIIGFLRDGKQDEEISGVKIVSFSEESLAKKAGLKEGDVIVGINNVKISKFSELTGQLAAKRPGESVDVTVDRDGEKVTKSVELVKRIPQIISNALGIAMKDLDEKELKKLKIEGGAKVTREARSDEDFSLIGYIITKVNGNKVKNAKDAQKYLDGFSRQGYRLNVEMINTEGEVERFVFR
jgi:S1-C subfamily serine protease